VSGSRSPWVWVGVGCAGCGLLGVIAVAVVGFVGYRAVKGLERDLRDPGAREARVKRLLGADELPAGYYPGPTVSIPFLFELAMLADRPVDSQGGLSTETTSVFIYVKAVRGGRKWRSYLDGTADPLEVLNDRGFRLERGERIARGTLALDGLDVDWVAQRGEMILERGHDLKGITTVMFLRCAGQRQLRVGVWSAPDPAEGTPVAELDLTGTPADPERIREFLSTFRLCSR